MIEEEEMAAAGIEDLDEDLKIDLENIDPIEGETGYLGMFRLQSMPFVISSY